MVEPSTHRLRIGLNALVSYERVPHAVERLVCQAVRVAWSNVEHVREIRQRVTADSIGLLRDRRIAFRKGSDHGGGCIHDRRERGQPILVDVLRAVVREQRIREMRLHQLRDPRLRLAEVVT